LEFYNSEDLFSLVGILHEKFLNNHYNIIFIPNEKLFLLNKPFNLESEFTLFNEKALRTSIFSKLDEENNILNYNVSNGNLNNRINLITFSYDENYIVTFSNNHLISIYEWDDSFETIGNFLDCFKRKKYELDCENLGYTFGGSIFIGPSSMKGVCSISMSTYSSLIGIGGITNPNGVIYSSDKERFSKICFPFKDIKFDVVSEDKMLSFMMKSNFILVYSRFNLQFDLYS